MSDSKLQGGSPHLCRLRTASVEPCGTSFDYVLTHAGFWGLINPVASVTTWSNHNRYSMVVIRGGMR
jgi:hypothetical protein